MNDDLVWIERIDQLSFNIFNPFSFCPICGSCNLKKKKKNVFFVKVIELKKNAVQPNSAIFTKSKGKYYLTHSECFKKSQILPDIPKIKKNINDHQCLINYQPNYFDIDSFKVTQSKKFYSVVWEFYHPISSLLYFRLDKILPVLEHKHNVFNF